MSDTSRDYDIAHTPPATPPTIDPDTKPLEARELAGDRGDNEEDGSVLHDPGDSEIAKERRDANLAMRDKRDGAGEAELDAMKPTTLLPPD